MLLRQLGIPARYAVGYAVHETSGRKYVVRQRDAHAWCLVWNATSETWQDFDTTPASWVAAEASRASPMQFLSDCWSRVVFEFAKFRWGQTHLRQYFLWALAPILALLLYQIIFRSRRRRHAPEPGSAGRSSPLAGTGLGILSNREAAGGAGRAAPTERAAFRLAAARHAPTRRWLK